MKLSKRERERLRKNIIVISVAVVLLAAIVLAIVMKIKKNNSQTADQGIVLIYQIDGEHTDEDVNGVLSVMEKRAKRYSENAEVYEKPNGDIVCKIPMKTKGYDPTNLIDFINTKGDFLLLDENNNNTYTSGNRYYVMAKAPDIVSSKAFIEKNYELDYDLTAISITFDDEKKSKIRDATADGKLTTFYMYIDGKEFAKVYTREQIEDATLTTYDIKDYNQANFYANLLDSGSYPVDVKLMIKEIN